MSAGTWTLYNNARKKLVTGVIDLDTSVLTDTDAAAAPLNSLQRSTDVSRSITPVTSFLRALL